MEIIFLVFLFILLEILSIYYFKYLNRIAILRITFFIGIFLHEFSHFLGCLLTFAPVKEFNVGFKKGHVIHGKSKIPIIGGLIISLAPLIVGTLSLLFLFLWITKSSYSELLVFIQPETYQSTQLILLKLFEIFKRIDFWGWQFLLYIFLSLNILATFTPSKQDYKNIAGSIIIYIILSAIFDLSGVNFVLIYVLIFALFLMSVATFLLGLYFIIKKLLFK